MWNVTDEEGTKHRSTCDC